MFPCLKAGASQATGADCPAVALEGAVVATVAYPLFIRISKPSGQVAALELTTDMAADSGLSLTAHLDVPLASGYVSTCDCSQECDDRQRMGPPYRDGRSHL
jgi:hypothetical protein